MGAESPLLMGDTSSLVGGAPSDMLPVLSCCCVGNSGGSEISLSEFGLSLCSSMMSAEFVVRACCVKFVLREV